MAKGDVKTPNKRKSFGNDTPAKKAKIENGKNNGIALKKQIQSPAKNQQASPKKFNKKNKPNQVGSDSNVPKNISPVAGTKQVTGTKQLDNKQQKKQKPPQKKVDSQSPDKKKKRRNQYNNLITNVKGKPGSKDPELLKSLTEKINAIKARPEITKTAKRKLAVLQKLKVICEEGAEAAAAQYKARADAEKAARGNKAEKKAAAKQAAQGKQKKAAVKVAPAKVKSEDDDEDSDEEASDNEESGEEEENDSGEEEESSDVEVQGKTEDDSDEEDDDDEEEDDDDDDDDDSFEEAPPVQEKPPAKKPKTKRDSTQEDKPKPEAKIKKQVDLDELKTGNLVTKGQKRFVLFIGNIPYDTTRQDLIAHFSKAGDIVHVRLPTEKGNNRPRGFGYVEVGDEITYQKCMSMHHSQIKGRRINVLYTQGGKKKGEEKKKEIKVKNMKLHGLRTQGKLAGSVKQSQKRSFRRKKGKDAQVKSED